MPNLKILVWRNREGTSEPEVDVKVPLAVANPGRGPGEKKVLPRGNLAEMAEDRPLSKHFFPLLPSEGASLPKGLFAFVVQKHKATSLHYDFRLEIGGEMPSWSIPKGPTLDPGVKRLAMPTGPHDLEYRKFEGVIPKGDYGAGPVMIWDEGTFAPEVETGRGVRRVVTDREEASEVAAVGLRDGNLKFTLYGKKLHGSFALVRTKGFGGGREAWLLIKHRDRHCRAGYDANDHGFSAESNRSLDEIAQEAQAPSSESNR